MFSRYLSAGNAFLLLAALLAPGHGNVKQGWRQAWPAGRIDWGRMVCLANRHCCTPLLYCRLRQKGWLEHLPADLQEYLALLHQANVERNQDFRLALGKLLTALDFGGMPGVVLKGGATFCDDLYGDNGARMMGDLDILVREEDAPRVCELLSGWGYSSLAEAKPHAYSPEFRHQHLPRMHLTGTPVAIEIHTLIEKGQSGRALPVGLAWAGRQEAVLSGIPTGVLNPTYRLLHNTVHAMVPHREFIRSAISLLQLAEFAALADRYGGEIDWAEWLARGRAGGLRREFSAYLCLANRLMGTERPAGVASGVTAPWHAARIVLAGEYLDPFGPLPSDWSARLARRSVGLMVQSFYNANRISWIWQNSCYVENNRAAALGYLAKKTLDTFRSGEAG